ncbi:MAG: IPT/TIG domain-containing protein [Solirubrobacterales bacterium]
MCAALLLPSSAAAALSLEESFATGGEPSPIAVDDSNGDIYFGDLTSGNVFRLDSTGAAKNFTCGTCSGNTLGGGFTFPGAGGSQIAVDSNSGRIYVTNLLSIEIFDNTGEFLGTLNGASTFNGEYAAACGVAVDQSSGNVYVGDIAERVWRYTPDGGTIEEADYSGGIVTPMPACNVAAAQGIVYAADSFNVGEVRAFDNTDFALGEPPSPSSTPIDTATTAIYADSTTADLYADKGSVIDVSDSSGADLYSFGSGDFGSSSGVAVMPSPTGNAYVTDLAAGEIDVFGPPPEPKKPFFELSIQKTGNGTVTSSPLGINCGLGCSALFEEGKVVGLEADPDADSEFVGWISVSGDPGTCTGTTSPCEVTMSDDLVLKAEFALKPPTVIGLDPTEGPIAGGNPVTIEGTDFATAEEVEFGPNAVACPSVDCTIDSNTQITVNAPAHAAGTVDVIVTNGGGPSANTPADDYTYVEVPTVIGLDPTQGPTTGGTTVTVEGTDLVNIEGIKFGNVPADLASLVETSPTEIEIEAPAHSAGAFAVVVTTPGGTSVDTPADDYTYVAPPAVLEVFPNKGPVAGGNEVEIFGMRFEGASKVEFGTTSISCPSSECEIEDDETIFVIAPAHAVGKVDVRVTTIGGTSGNFPVDDYTFEGPAALTVNKAGTGSGSVTCDGGACAPTYAFGTEVTLAASPSAGSSFGGWSGGGCAGTGPCAVTMEANITVTATFNADPLPLPPPPPPNCVVPKVKGMKLGKAKSALKDAHCTTGKVTKPKPKKGKKQGPLVVKSSQPVAGTILPADSKVDLRLKHKPKK